MAFSRHRFVLKAVSDISHGDTRTGLDNPTNTRLFMQTTKTVDGETFVVPEISGNALRSVIFRRTLANDLMDRLEIKAGDLTPAVHNLLYNGGVLSKSADFDILPLILSIRRLYPSLDLIGGAVDSFTLSRGRLTGVGVWPMLAEYREDIQDVAPDLADEDLPKSYDVLDMKTRTSSAQDSKDAKIYSYQVMSAGVRILGELTLESGTPDATRACAGVALRDWDMYFGGQARQGHGRMVYLEKPEIDTTAYEQHVEEHKEEMRSGILDGVLGTGRVVVSG